MMETSRFICPSWQLSLSKLLRRTQRVLWTMLGATLVVHALLPRIGTGERIQQAAKPLTTKFVKRQPRLTKPLEMKKRPRPKQRRIQRRMISVQAKVKREATETSPISAQVVTDLARPAVKVDRGTSFMATDLEPEAVAAIVEGSKEHAKQVDMSLEMVDIEALDTGRYQAMIIQDPKDKRNIKGFLHLARMYSVNTPPEEAGLPYPDPTALGNLIVAVNQYTDIEADIAGTYTLDSQELLKTPFIVITCHVQFRLNESEKVNLGKYLDQGGFLFADDCSWLLGGVSDICLRTMIQDALDSRGFRKGFDYTWEILPKDHPVYHCYFDFNGAPRTPWTYDRRIGGRGSSSTPEPEGVTLHGRLAVMYSHWDIGCAWEGPKVYAECQGLQHLRALQLGINMLIFAMTQEGSITYRVLSEVSY